MKRIPGIWMLFELMGLLALNNYAYIYIYVYIHRYTTHISRARIEKGSLGDL